MRLFSDMYPWAGQDRAALAPNLAIGKAGRYDLFAHPQDARRAAEHALGMGNDPAKMRAKPGEVMGLLAYAHPMLDGNGRTLMVVHAELCRRAGIRLVWENVQKADYLAALTRELDQPGKPLDAFLAPHVRRPAASVTQDVQHLSALPGLGPGEGNPTSPVSLAMGTATLPARNPVLDVAAALHPPPPATDAPWNAAPTPLRDRLAAFEVRKAEEARKVAPEPAPDAAPSQGPAQSPTPPKPRGGPGPGS